MKSLDDSETDRRQPFFSVVIPAYNRETLIAATLDSVLCQECSDVELIVVDDGSTDRTCEVVARYGDRVTLLRQKNQGPGVARNLGTSHARGEYVAFLDSDDLWFPWTLQAYRQSIREYDFPSLVAGCVVSFSTESEIGNVHPAPPRCQYFPDFLASCREEIYVGAGMVAIRRDVLQDVGGFCSNKINCEDHDLVLRLGAAAGFLQIHSPPTLAYRRHLQALTGDILKTFQGGCYLLERELAGAYPGGGERMDERLQVITRHVRPISVACFRQRHFRYGWELYFRTFHWHFQLKRWRFLAGVPVAALRSAILGVLGVIHGP